MAISTRNHSVVAALPWFWWCFLVMTGCVIMMSCRSPSFVADQQIPIVKNQPYVATQQSPDYQLQYRYVFQKGGGSAADRLQFSGELTPRRGLGTLTVRLHFLDASGQILATEILYASGKGQGAGACQNRPGDHCSPVRRSHRV